MFTYPASLSSFRSSSFWT